MRVKHADESAAWAKLRPGTEFIALDIGQIFELFPIPHGTQRQSITKLLADWQWKARALQPSHGNFRHMAWRVGATDPPPYSVMQGFDLDIVITIVKDLKQSTQEPKIIASSKTQKHLRDKPAPASSSASNEDPWHNWKPGSSPDPWGGRSKLPATASAANQKSRLTEIREELCKEVKQTVSQQLAEHAANMEVTEETTLNEQTEGRFQALEVGLQEIQAQNSQFMSWFSEAGTKMANNEKAIGEIQHTLNSHQQEISSLGSTFQHSMKNMKDDLSREMNASFTTQMSKLEALLDKRQRTGP